MWGKGEKMPTEKQLNNLKPLNKRTKSEQREISSKGGKARAKKQKEKKNFQEIAKTILNLAMKSGDRADLDKISSIAELNGKNLTVEEGIVLKQAMKALQGDRFAAEFIRDTAGEKPVEKQDLNVRTIDKSLEAMEAYFNDKARDT